MMEDGGWVRMGRILTSLFHKKLTLASASLSRLHLFLSSGLIPDTASLSYLLSQPAASPTTVELIYLCSPHPSPDRIPDLDIQVYTFRRHLCLHLCAFDCLSCDICLFSGHHGLMNCLGWDRGLGRGFVWHGGGWQKAACLKNTHTHTL